MDEFKAGDKVLCINEDDSTDIETGLVYTVNSYFQLEGYPARVTLTGKHTVHNASQFKLVEPPTTRPVVSAGIKHDQGKPPVSLIPTVALMGMAKVFGFGAKKYGRHNFRLGMDHSRMLDAAIRHLLAIADGEDIDPESGEPHWAHALCSIAMYAYNVTAGVGTDDRHKPTKENKNV